MSNENDIPEEIDYNQSFKPGRSNNPIPIDDNIVEELPVTESQEWKRIRDSKNPKLSKVVDETVIHGDKDEQKDVPKTEEFTFLNKIINPSHNETSSSSRRYSPPKNKFNSRKRNTKFEASSRNSEKREDARKTPNLDIKVKQRSQLSNYNEFQKQETKKQIKVEKTVKESQSKSVIESKEEIKSETKTEPKKQSSESKRSKQSRFNKTEIPDTSENDKFNSLYENKPRRTPKPAKLKETPLRKPTKYTPQIKSKKTVSNNYTL